jgi:hypothetical protein
MWSVIAYTNIIYNWCQDEVFSILTIFERQPDVNLVYTLFWHVQSCEKIMAVELVRMLEGGTRELLQATGYAPLRGWQNSWELLLYSLYHLCYIRSITIRRKTFLMGHRSNKKRKQHGLYSLDQLIPNYMSDFSNSTNKVSYCSPCGGITMNIQASGLAVYMRG